MKKTCIDALSSEPILSLKNIEGKLFVTNSGLCALLDLHTPPVFIDDSVAEFHAD